MKLEDMRESDNVEDRTGMGPAGGGFGGGGIKLGGAALLGIVGLCYDPRRASFAN